MINEEDNDYTKVHEYWYRAHMGRPEPDGRHYIMVEPYLVLRKTKCGVWLRDIPRYAKAKGDRFVLFNDNGGRRYAYATREEALKSLLKRMQSRYHILTEQLKNTTRVRDALLSGQYDTHTGSPAEFAMLRIRDDLDIDYGFAEYE